MSDKRKYIIKASGYYLTEHLDEEFFDWDGEKQKEFIREHAWEPFENEDPEVIMEHIYSMSSCLLADEIPNDFHEAVDSIRAIMERHDLACVTSCNAVKQEDMICDPSTWVIQDLIEGCNLPDDLTPEQIIKAYFSTRAYKTMGEGLTTWGYETLQNLVHEAADYAYENFFDDDGNTLPEEDNT